MDSKTRAKFHREILKAVKKRYPKGNIYYDAKLVKTVTAIHKQYREPVNSCAVLHSMSRVLSAACLDDDDIEFNGAAFTNKMPDPLGSGKFAFANKEV